MDVCRNCNEQLVQDPENPSRWNSAGAVAHHPFVCPAADYIFDHVREASNDHP